MADDDLIRPHDPFSGHEDPAPADDTTEPVKPAEAPTPPAEPAKKPAARKPGRRPRRTPSAAEVENSARRSRRR